ncbi:MAG: T9SS type A sorting domain-containing protein, partial [candidate division Zixibacteria bacterium]|nr:T9SS type A sorting domain-containing protein [candidate division Zixibacteria bacterium]
GHVINSDDCDDSNGDIGAPKIWYLDGDGDNFGDPSEELSNCTQPAGHVRNNLDCDDSDETINPNTLWYLDSDGDNFGDPSEELSSCTQPAGHVRNNLDCDDSDETINPNTLWYLDSDEDNFGDLSEKLSNCTQPTGYVRNNSDCNDSDSLINPNTIWYEDLDEDGFGDSENSFTGCIPPLLHVLDNSDNCVELYNPDQADTNSNGIGDICDDLHTGISEDESRTLPDEFALFQNYPNPFNSETIISFNIPYQIEGDLAIYNLLGERIYTISEGWLKPGRFHFSWDGKDKNNSNLPSGVYFYRLNTSDITLSKKMIYLK